MSKIKNFFEDIFLKIKNRLFSSKYILKGKCKRCGACCRSILFSTENGYVKSEDVFKKLQKKYFRYRHYKITGKITGKQDFQEGALTFTCCFIAKNNRCMIYPFRPIFCRNYPEIKPDLIYHGVETLDECGFYFDIDKKFKEYLNDSDKITQK